MNGLITLTPKMLSQSFPPQKPLAAMSSLQLFSAAVLWVMQVSPVRH